LKALPAQLLVVTDRYQTARPLEQVITDVLAAGARWIWLRDRDLDPAARRALALSLRALTREVGGHLSIGADVELAADIAADGAHLQSAAAVAAARRLLGAKASIGVSAHSLADVRDAANAGADYVTLSPIFASASKPGYGPALGAPAIAEAARHGIAIVALGGVTPANAGRCLAAGAAGVAMMGEIMRAPDSAVPLREIFARIAGTPISVS
jgi:thiamine-phosphate pyrophosphorylase